MKCGLDDYLLTHTVEDLMNLPKVTLSGPGWALEKKAHKAREARREKKQAVEAEVEEEKKEEIPKELIAKAWLTQDLIKAVSNTLKRFVFIKDDRLYLLISVWILATYIYTIFDYIPILWITSPTKRSGKTRLLEVLAQLVSRSSGIKINPTEAILFTSTNRGLTLLLDEVERLKKSDHELYGTVMAILNSGFQKGATVSRMRKNKDGEFVAVDYQTFGPKIIAGIANVTDTIADRSLAIKMIRRVRATETLERFRLRKLTKELGSLVLQLKVWAAARLKDIQAIYDGIEQEPDELRDADDRFLDIVEPLLAIALLADAESVNGAGRIFDELVALLDQMGADRDEALSDAAIVVALDIIGSLLGDNSKLFVPSADILKSFKEKSATAWIKTGKTLANFLNKIDLRPKPEGGGKRRGYYIERSWLSDMIARYPSTNADDADEPSTNADQPQQVSQGKLFQ